MIPRIARPQDVPTMPSHAKDLVAVARSDPKSDPHLLCKADVSAWKTKVKDLEQGLEEARADNIRMQDYMVEAHHLIEDIDHLISQYAKNAQNHS